MVRYKGELEEVGEGGWKDCGGGLGCFLFHPQLLNSTTLFFQLWYVKDEGWS